MTYKQPWDDIFDFKYYRVSKVRKIVTHMKVIDFDFMKEELERGKGKCNK